MDNGITEVQVARLAELRAEEFKTLSVEEKAELKELEKVERESK